MAKDTLLNKTYTYEDLPDIEEDVSHMLETKNIPEEGTYRVEIVYCSPDDCDCVGFQHSDKCPNHWSNCGGDTPY
jgi:hypothetical protein